MLSVVGMPRRSATGLMLVDNPNRFFTSLCRMRGQTFSADEYWTVLASLTRKGHIHRKTRDTYIYTATIFKLITQTDTGSHRYQLALSCEKICDTLGDRQKKETYRRYLRGLLMSNEIKGPLFREFLRYTSTPRRMADIESEFGKIEAKTLFAFFQEAGLVVRHGGMIRAIEVRSSVSIDEFYQTLGRVYHDLRENTGTQPPMIYVPIDLIRDLVSLELGLESSEEFDALLVRVCDSTTGSSIYLHGAPPHSCLRSMVSSTRVSATPSFP